MKFYTYSGLAIFMLLISVCSNAITVSIIVQPATCGNSSGWAEAYPGGGTAPYTYNWSNGLTTKRIERLAPGSYILMVSDTFGSTVMDTVTIGNSTSMSCTMWGPYRPAGFNSSGEVRIYNLNGIPPYTMTWCDGWTDTFQVFGSRPGLSGLTASGGCNLTNNGVDYYLTSLTDSTGCTMTAPISVFTIASMGFAPPNPLTTGECNHSMNGSIIDTLDQTDSTFLVGGLPYVWDKYYNVSIALRDSALNTLIDSTIIVSYSGSTIYAYSFTGLAAGTYKLEYRLRDHNAYIMYRTAYVTVSNLGTNCGNLSGNIFADVNANCTNDPGDINEPTAIVKITPGNFYTLTDNNGNYSIDLSYGSYSVNHFSGYQAPLQTLCPQYGFANVTINSGQNNVVQDFADTSAGADIIADISMSTPHPGMQVILSAKIFNLSIQNAVDDTVTINYSPVFNSPVYSYPTISTSATSATFLTGVIPPMGSRIITITLQVPTNPGLIGTSVGADVAVVHNGIDVDLNNNTDSVTQIITGSFDPNHISSSPTGYDSSNFIPKTTKWIDYQIEFMNTGTDSAYNIVVDCPIHYILDISSFEFLGSSHTCTPVMKRDGTLQFVFNNIFLPDSGTDLNGSMGFVNFRLRIKYPSNNSIIDEQAGIFFDFNPPVYTNINSLRLYDCNQILNALPLTYTTCENNSQQVFATASVPCNLNWTVGGNVFTGNPATITGLPAGSDTIFVTANTPYCSQTKNTQLISLPSPTVTLTMNNDTLFAISTLSTFQWFLDGDSIQGATNSFYVYQNPGNYSVMVIDNNGCTGNAGPLLITGVKRLNNENDNFVYPNPGHDKLFFTTPVSIPEFSIRIYDSTGRLTYNSKNINAIDVSHFPTGLYNIILSDNKQQWSVKWVKE